MRVGAAAAIACPRVRLIEAGEKATVGVGSFTRTLSVMEALWPVELVAVTTCGVAGQVAVGVPEISPVELWSANPDGRAGLIAKLVASTAVGVPELKACVRTAVSWAGVYENTGAGELTVMLTTDSAVWPVEFEAVKVKPVAASVVAGVPVTIPVPAASDIPWGSSGLTVTEVAFWSTGTIECIAVPRVSATEDWANVIEGEPSFTRSWKVVWAVCPVELVAVAV